ncbi:MAG TPA: HIT family protein [Candidatus Saccharimonadales bacterium]|nr:HIT family protein [Candidatus Saccharimonadales bacterium]
MNCHVCEEVDNDGSRLLFQTEYWRVILSYDQAYVGRLFIPLRVHKGSLGELTDEEWSDFKEIVRKVEQANAKVFGGRPFNWLCMMNDAFKQIPANPHVHWHMLPRYDHDIEINGQIFTDPDYGRHYDKGRWMRVTDELAQAIIDRLKPELA